MRMNSASGWRLYSVPRILKVRVWGAGGWNTTQRRLSGLKLEVRPVMIGYSYSNEARPGCKSYKRFYNFTRATSASCSEQAKLASKQAKTYKFNCKYTSCALLRRQIQCSEGMVHMQSSIYKYKITITEHMFGCQ